MQMNEDAVSRWRWCARSVRQPLRSPLISARRSDPCTKNEAILISALRTNLTLGRQSIDLDEEITRVLTAENSHGPKNLVVFSNREKQFVPIGNAEQLAVHHFYEGNLLPIDSDEAKLYAHKEQPYGTTIRPTALLDVYKTKPRVQIEIEPPDESLPFPLPAVDEDESRTVTSDTTEISELNELPDDSMPVSPMPDAVTPSKLKKMLNRFNFCEQGIQTSSSSSKDVTMLTDPMPNRKFVGLANQRIIFQEYAADFAKQEKEKDKRKQKATYGPNKGAWEKKVSKVDRLKPETVATRRQVRVLTAIELVLNQNRHHELIYKFKYFEDRTDEIRDPIGTLLPLWKFSSAYPDRSVTALAWNPAYSDMLIVGYGLYDRAARIPGTIAVFTLNSSHPATLIHPESTVLSIDCLPSQPHLICVGLMDGDVIVYDISVPSGRAAFTNRSYLCKHLGCVWQVQWCASPDEHHPRFCSAGGDGKVMRWTCIRGELRQILLLDLSNASRATRLDDGTLLTMPDPLVALDIHRRRSDVFLVGTESGKIYRASINDPGMIDATFTAHDFAVYAVRWSSFHPNVFASCSADGTVKIWHEKVPECLMRFDLCTSLQDIAWSPFTSTVFVAAGADGKAYVFDIHSNRLEPICEQLLAETMGKTCTKIAFNALHPILLAGDAAGWTTCLKLSPNLRKKAKLRKGAEYPASYNPELDKLAQELARTVAGDILKDILHAATAENDD